MVTEVYHDFCFLSAHFILPGVYRSCMFFTVVFTTFLKNWKVFPLSSTMVWKMWGVWGWFVCFAGVCLGAWWMLLRWKEDSSIISTDKKEVFPRINRHSLGIPKESGLWESSKNKLSRLTNNDIPSGWKHFVFKVNVH